MFSITTMFYIIYCFWASYFFACLRGVARSLGTQYFVSLFACAGVARPLVNHIHHLYFHGFLSGFPISSSITNCIIIVIISGSSMSSGSGSGISSSSSNSSCCWEGRGEGGGAREWAERVAKPIVDGAFWHRLWIGLYAILIWFLCLCFLPVFLYLCFVSVFSAFVGDILVLTLGSMDFLRCCAWACAGMRAGLRGLVRGGCAFRGFGWHSKYDVFHVFLVWGCA